MKSELPPSFRVSLGRESVPENPENKDKENQTNRESLLSGMDLDTKAGKYLKGLADEDVKKIDGMLNMIGEGLETLKHVDEDKWGMTEELLDQLITKGNSKDIQNKIEGILL